MALFPECACFQIFAQVVFACIFLNFLWGCWNFIYVYFMGTYPDFHKYGKWSVVTGGTDGIGLAFVNKLAALGQNIVVISRNPEKVEKVALEVSEKYKVKTKQIAVDFGHGDIYPKIAKELEDIDVGTLVNNVGVAQDIVKFLKIVDHGGNLENILTVNAESLVKMTRLILPGMIKKRKGIVVNMGSGSGICPTPLLSVYSSTKKFVDCFSKCMHSEYADKGIITLSFMPWFVATKMSEISQPNFLVPCPEHVVSSALKTIGRCRRSYGCISHFLQGKLCEDLPESFVSWILRHILSRAREHVRGKPTVSQARSQQ
uniref:Estradiol 17-beta-dehydrogenase 12 n=1 Tax=Phallusia mammillata TaxID=59560 RepID=A0A6F9DFF5_9ASCI|nr:estradiol 17-beta-dehydrogenase 12 [Phallusia mammillata]